MALVLVEHSTGRAKCPEEYVSSMSATSKSLMGSDFSAMSFGLLHLKPRLRRSRLMVKMLSRYFAGPAFRIGAEVSGVVHVESSASLL